MDSGPFPFALVLRICAIQKFLISIVIMFDKFIQKYEFKIDLLIDFKYKNDL